VRLTRILERDVSIASEMRNAFIGLSQMTVSCVVVETDATRGGEPLRG